MQIPIFTNRIISIDPGNIISGLVVLDKMQITQAQICDNMVLFDRISQFHGPDTLLVIEDIKPYSVPLGQTVIDTCKFIGELNYRLKSAYMRQEMVTRGTIKSWCFNRFPGVCIPRIEKKILAKGKFEACDVKTQAEIFVNKSGKRWRNLIPNENYVDDRIVIACMKAYWAIRDPKPGKTNEYGIRAHAWQALAVGTYAMSGKGTV